MADSEAWDSPPLAAGPAIRSPGPIGGQYQPPPPPKSPFPYKSVAIGVGIGGAILLGGYGVYVLLNNLSGGGGNPGAGLTACEQNWQTAYNGWVQQQQAYQKANVAAGLPPTLTSAQLAALQPYVDQMNSAETCIQQEANYSISQWSLTLTEIALGVAAIAGLTYYMKARLQAKGGSEQFNSGAEARATTRGALAQEQLDSSTISSSEAAGLNQQASQVGLQEAADESAALGDTAAADSAAAQAAGDLTLVDEIEVFSDTVIVEVTAAVTAAIDYFAALFG